MVTRPSLDKIYQPVQEDLYQVKEWLKSVTRVDYNRLAELLAFSIDNGGKLIRPALVLLSGKFYRYDLTTLLPMATSVDSCIRQPWFTTTPSTNQRPEEADLP